MKKYTQLSGSFVLNEEAKEKDVLAWLTSNVTSKPKTQKDKYDIQFKLLKNFGIKFEEDEDDWDFLYPNHGEFRKGDDILNILDKYLTKI